MSKNASYTTDPSDGLRAAIVGEWSGEKHARLRRYIDITRATRRKYPIAGTGYIDLYCGPGRAQLRDSGEFVDGSPLVAFNQSAQDSPFTGIHIGDADATNVQTCQQRLGALNAQGVNAYVGDAIDTARQVVGRLHQHGLYLAFLDPYSIGALPFDVIRTLAACAKIDFIIHVSTMDLQRNVLRDLKSKALEKFAPGCTDNVNLGVRNELLVQHVFRSWRGSIEKLGFKMSDNIERISGSHNQPLYWLVLASRHDLGTRFWKNVSNISAQGRLQL